MALFPVKDHQENRLGREGVIPADDGSSRPGAGGVLFVVATPLGNLEDITLRALRILREVDLIAAEDTRRTRILLQAHDIQGARLVSYHDHNERRRAPQLLDRLASGAAIALVTDAGSALISDPGYHLIRGAVAGGHAVRVIPGPSAPVAALQAAGFTADSFVFHGYAPRTAGRREKLARQMAAEPRTQLLFETPHRLGRTLDALAARMPHRPAVLCRELTKRHEEIVRGDVGDIATAARERRMKGEMVLVVGPLPKAASRKGQTG
ncbi:MAG: 16S rRNA (cytidine(1402)-2'-O)-methyltransferase [Candidatus Eisenbacteria bacterium]|nr:16S rRNA (cytidine(1402)-2'-O)-methyltransferase [Candidatus Eisenbacteria bacterium]